MSTQHTTVSSTASSATELSTDTTLSTKLEDNEDNYISSANIVSGSRTRNPTNWFAQQTFVSGRYDRVDFDYDPYGRNDPAGLCKNFNQ